ncbi:MAG: hypothetical protein UE970_08135 [Catenibacillus sp.]|nr:hypothetical protein [Catenibacillus sp.]
MADNDFDDPYIQKIYDNCKKGISESRGNWQRAADFIKAQAIKRPEKNVGLLECYNRLEAEFK